MSEGHATMRFSLEELRLIAHCITFALVRDGLNKGEWRDAKTILDEIAVAIHEGNIRREDNEHATRDTEQAARLGQAEAADPGAGWGGVVEPDR